MQIKINRGVNDHSPYSNYVHCIIFITYFSQYPFVQMCRSCDVTSNANYYRHLERTITPAENYTNLSGFTKAHRYT